MGHRLDGFGLSCEDWRDITRAVGLWHDFNRHGRLVDPWGWLVDAADHPEGFITRTVYDSYHNTGRLDWLRAAGSQVGLHDGRTVTYTETWTQCGEGMEKMSFIISGATFALVELMGIPERVFLFPNSGMFDLYDIIAQLEDYRAIHPPRIFILPTASVGKKK